MMSESWFAVFLHNAKPEVQIILEGIFMLVRESSKYTVQKFVDQFDNLQTP